MPWLKWRKGLILKAFAAAKVWDRGEGIKEGRL